MYADGFLVTAIFIEDKLGWVSGNSDPLSPRSSGSARERNFEALPHVKWRRSLHSALRPGGTQRGGKVRISIAANKMKNWLKWSETRLLGVDRALLKSIFYQRLAKLASCDLATPKILLLEAQPERFLGSLMAAITAECWLFLGNPHWSDRDRQSVLEYINPDAIWNDTDLDFINAKSPSMGFRDRVPSVKICIPTGGTSGQIRFAVHTWETLSASVAGFAEYFDTAIVNSCCTLPLYHVSGLMQWMRSLLTGGTLAIVPSYKNLCDRVPDNFDPDRFFISLVPTQLHRLLQYPNVAQWLSRFQTVLLGGAPAWPSLLDRARKYRIPVAPTYGSTETASQIATLKPDEFLAGHENCGRILPHAGVTICDENGEALPAGKIGTVTVRSRSLFLGYYDRDRCTSNLHGQTDILTNNDDKNFVTDDLGYFDDRGYLHIVGRNSQKIITGGENVYPAAVEAAIRSTDLVIDIAVIGIEDPEWGQAVTAIYVPKTAAICEQILKAAVVEKLSKYEQPKRWIKISAIPRNDRGKVNYKMLQEIVN